MKEYIKNNKPTEKKLPLTHEEKKSLRLICIGTFLEYFDFCAYIHISVILNELFFPKSDPQTKALLIALSFSMSYILRPLGSLIFGLLGDSFGRKKTIIITTFSMAISSLCLAFLPTYEQIGLKASYLVLLCRIVQGISSAVEFTGAKIYITEITQKSHHYFYAAFLGAMTDAGSIFSLVFCLLMLHIFPEYGWRFVFLFGSVIAIIGLFFRKELKESQEFLEETKKLKQNDGRKSNFFTIIKQHSRNIFSYFLIELISPFLSFTCFIHIGEILINKLGYTPIQVIKHNLYVTLLSFVVHMICILLTRYVYPIKILKFTTLLLFLSSLSFSYLTNKNITPIDIFIIQVISWSLNVTYIGASVFVNGFRTIGRFTLMGVSFSLARAVGAIITSYGCMYVSQKYSFDGISALMICMVTLYAIGLYLFIPLKNKC